MYFKSIDKRGMSENVLSTIMHKMEHSQYFTAAYHTWSFVQLSEQQYNDMYQDDLDRAL